MRGEDEVTRAITLYADMIRRICLCHLKNREDCEDIFQTVFLKYMLYDKPFADAEHEKAWLIRAAINACKDHLKSLFRHRTVALDALTEEAAQLAPAHREVLEAVLALPAKYKDAIYLHYYEGYPAAKIALILHTRESTVYSLLSRGRALLREKLGGEGLDE